MSKIYSYVLRFDDGVAPNPFHEICTLAICKPVIRRNAKIGDWVVGTGSKNALCNDEIKHDLSEYIVYAMKITEILTLQEYDAYCKKSLNGKIPNSKSKNWKVRMGDCIYDYSAGGNPTIRGVVHNEGNRKTDLSGINALLSSEFYYFGEQARILPIELAQIIKQNQGHKKIENAVLISRFEKWIQDFEINKVYADPQMRFKFDTNISEEFISKCAKEQILEDENEIEETVC